MAGNIKVIPAKDNYQRVSKDIILNKQVDALTLGVYVKVLALGKNFELNVKGLASILKLSEDKIRKSFSVLESTGYLRRSRSQGEHGHFSGWDYEIASTPFTDIAILPTSEKTDVGENRMSESTDVGVLTHNNKIYTDTVKIDTVTTETSSPKSDDTSATFTPPTVEEVYEYVKTFGMKDPDGFARYYVDEQTRKGWTWKNRNKIVPVKDWKNNVRQWAPNHMTQIFPKIYGQEPAKVVSAKDFFHK